MSMKVFVHVKEKVILVQCGAGQQKVRWLGDVGIARYDSSYGKNLGPAKAIKRDDGEVLNPTDIISGVVQPDEHVWVTFEDSES